MPRSRRKLSKIHRERIGRGNRKAYRGGLSEPHRESIAHGMRKAWRRVLRTRGAWRLPTKAKRRASARRSA